jgi:hypothetical protein
VSVTHYPESMSGPRERKWGAPCVICTQESEIQCDNCHDNICLECAVSCAHCQTDAYCIPCAIKRTEFEQINGEWYCGNCAPEFEPELEEARR